VSPLNFHGLPRIRSLSDLTKHTGVPSQQLWLFLFRSKCNYRTFRLPKKSGGFRVISHPAPSLKSVQRWILRNILDRLHETDQSYGFTRGSKLVDHARQHAYAKAILSVDIENFFPSIRGAQVTGIFKLAGYQSAAASMLARLCTYNGALPQGAPSSPKLANFACFRMDCRFAQLAEREGLVYTRYADDMTFSGASATVLARLRPLVSHIVLDCQLRLNKRKSRLAGAARTLKVTGLVVSSGRVGIGRQRLRTLRARIYALHKVANEAELLSIQGWLDYVWDVDRDRYGILLRYIKHLRSANHDSSLRSLRVRTVA